MITRSECNDVVPRGRVRPVLDPKQTNPLMSFKRPLYLTLTMTLPFARPLFTYAMASLVDANGKT